MGQENFDKLVTEAREYIDFLEKELEDETTEQQKTDTLFNSK